MKATRRCNPMFSEEDADLAAFNWLRDRPGYATRQFTTKPNYKQRLSAHRIVLTRMVGRSLNRDELCDHINGDKMDNRRCNLRLTDHRGNAQNRYGNRHGGVGIRGASREAKTGRWNARVTHKGKDYHVGTFNTPEEAGAAAAVKRQELGFLESVSPHYEPRQKAAGLC